MARRRRDASLTVAICLSLVAHGGIGLALLEGETSAARRRMPQAAAVDRSAVAVGPVLVTPEDEPGRKPPAVEEVPKLPPLLLPKPKPEPEPAYLKSVFGEPEGKGDAEQASPGEEEMHATRKAPENQAFLSKDPVGAGRVGDPPSMSTAAPGEGGQGKAGPIRKSARATPAVPVEPKVSLLALPREERVAPPPAPVGVTEPRRERVAEAREKAEPEKPFGVPSERVEAVLPRKARKVAEGPAGMIAVANPAGVPERAEAGAKAALVPPVVALATPGPRPAVARQEESGGRPGKAAPAAADPAPMSESEADAFGKVVDVEFRNGRMEAQTGRRIKTVRPKLLLSAQYELISQDDPRVLLTAKVDATGHVTKVDIYQSSGTPDLDQPCLVALYDWWFEPPKDKDGKPMPDVVVVAITFRTK
jgi:TonB family protein